MKKFIKKFIEEVLTITISLIAILIVVSGIAYIFLLQNKIIGAVFTIIHFIITISIIETILDFNK